MSRPVSRRRFLGHSALAAGSALGAGGLALAPRSSAAGVFAQAEGDTLVIGLPQTQRTDEFDVSQVFEFQTKIFAFCVSESLVLFDYRDLQYHPRLAESWEIAADLKSIVFNLRPGVTFHDGSPFNADAVVFSFERIFKPDNPDGAEGNFFYAAMVPFYESTEKLDDLTVRVNFSQEDALILQRFAIDPSYIAHPDSVRTHGNRAYSTEAANYIGTGPYRAVELRPTELVRLERNEEWWGPKPAFKNLVFRLFANNTQGADARVNALLARELDVALYLPGQRREDVAGVEGLAVEWFPQFVLNYYYLNHTLPFFTDKRVRQAMAMSFDRQTFYESTVGQTIIPHGAFWYPDSPFYNADATVDYNPERAVQLLEEAGFTEIGSDGIRLRPSDNLRAAFEFQWAGAANQQPPDDRVFWAEQMRDLLGVEATLEAFDPGLSADFEQGPLAPQNLGIYSWGVGTWLGDPEFAYNRWTTAELTPQGFNASQYSNPEIDELFLASRGESDEAARIELFQRMQAIAVEDIPWIPTNIGTLGGAWWTDRVTNVTAGATQYSYPWTYELPAP